MAKTTAPKAPAHLKSPTADWWRRVMTNWTLEEHHVRLLTLAAESWDRGQQAREALATNGLTFMDRFQQPHARPEIAIERDSRIAFARLVRELGLDVEEPSTSGPPTIKGNASRRIED